MASAASAGSSTEKPDGSPNGSHHALTIWWATA
jgi:hypothetical protein